MANSTIVELRDKYEKAKNELMEAIKNCNHRWSVEDTSYKVTDREARNWGDTIPQWKRTCMECGVVQHTTEFVEMRNKEKVPDWSNARMCPI